MVTIPVSEGYNFTAVNGTTLERFKFTPSAGKITHAVIVPSGDLPNHIIDISIKLNNGGEIVKPVDIRLWEMSGAGNYFERFKVINYDAKGTELELCFDSCEALTADFKFQLVLMYDDPNNAFNRQVSSC